MKYITLTPNGFEIRSDTNHELPIDAIELTNYEYHGLINGELQYINGQIIPI